MIPLDLTPAQAEAIDDLRQGYDLIGRMPRPWEVDEALARPGAETVSAHTNVLQRNLKRGKTHA